MTDQKVILITGTSSGFGYQTALHLAEQGHRVYASMRAVQGKNAPAAQALRQANENISILEIDVTLEETIDAAIGEVIAEQGRIDVLINNAGIMNIGLTEAFSVEQLHQQMDVNYFGVARMFKAVLPHMRDQRSGLVITITSIAGRLIFPAFTSYNSSKFATEALAEGYRYELSSYGVDSVILEPGPFKTELVGNLLSPKDDAVLKAYGEFAEMPAAVIGGFSEFMEENQAGDCDPKIVSHDIAKLIETPFGERPLRTVSGIDYGTRELNKGYATYQRGALEAMEMSHLDPNLATLTQG